MGEIEHLQLKDRHQPAVVDLGFGAHHDKMLPESGSLLRYGPPACQ